MNIQQSTAKLLTEVRKQIPLVHNITNYVTVNDVANAVLAIGGSPIMADDFEEAADITSIAKALVINIGTLNQRTIDSMISAGKRANELGNPVILDPVGAGASRLRNATTQEIIENVEISIIRGNLSEISFIAGLNAAAKGVDVAAEDEKHDAVEVAKDVAKKLNCITVITGPVDVVSDGTSVLKIANGHPLLAKVTGTGCMTSALIGAYAGVTKDYFTAAAAGTVSMGLAGEIAYEKAGQTGTGSFHIAIIDALSNLDGKMLEEMAKFAEE